MLVRRLGELFRKLWNPRNFKSHVSPHEMLQAVSTLSKKKFKITEQGGPVAHNRVCDNRVSSMCGVSSGDPVEFLLWLLHTLHGALGGSKRPGSSVVHKIFQGAMKITTRKLPPASEVQ